MANDKNTPFIVKAILVLFIISSGLVSIIQFLIWGFNLEEYLGCTWENIGVSLWSVYVLFISPVLPLLLQLFFRYLKWSFFPPWHWWVILYVGYFLLIGGLDLYNARCITQTAQGWGYICSGGMFYLIEFQGWVRELRHERKKRNNTAIALEIVVIGVRNKIVTAEEVIQELELELTPKELIEWFEYFDDLSIKYYNSKSRGESRPIKKLRDEERYEAAVKVLEKLSIKKEKMKAWIEMRKRLSKAL